MRKPLVVVCLTASAVLLAGGIAATTAGADTTPPDIPAVPALDLPAAPAVPQLPPDPAGGQDDPGRPAGDPLVALPGLPLPAATTDKPAPADRPAQDKPAQDKPAQDKPGQDKPAQTGGPAPADRPTQDEPAQDEPAQNRPAQRPGDAARPAGAPAQQRPASTWAAAQQDVSPGAPVNSVSAPVQRQVLVLVNENRRRGGCDNLTLDQRLIVAANRHAADMARRGYFAHRSPNGKGAAERVEDAGYRWSRYGENIARGQDSPYEVVDGWMDSPEHRENIMDCRLTEMGVGLAFDRERTPYWVQDFATPQ